MDFFLFIYSSYFQWSFRYVFATFVNILKVSSLRLLDSLDTLLGFCEFLMGNGRILMGVVLYLDAHLAASLRFPEPSHFLQRIKYAHFPFWLLPHLPSTYLIINFFLVSAKIQFFFLQFQPQKEKDENNNKKKKRLSVSRLTNVYRSFLEVVCARFNLIQSGVKKWIPHGQPAMSFSAMEALSSELMASVLKHSLFLFFLAFWLKFSKSFWPH